MTITRLPLRVAKLLGQTAAAPTPLDADLAPTQVDQRFALATAALARDRGWLAEAQKILEELASLETEPEIRKAAADEVVLLASAWQSQAESAEAPGRAEGLLRLATRLWPQRGLPVLARHLRQMGRGDEAIDQLREAVRLSPDDTTSQLMLGRLLEGRGQADDAARVYLALVQAAPSMRNYLIAADRLEALRPAMERGAPARSLRVALLGNATMAHLRAYLLVEFARAGLGAEIYEAGFDQYHREILDGESGLYRFNPDAIICAIHASRLFPHIHADPFRLPAAERRTEVEAGIATLRELLDTLTRRTNALVLLHNMVIPQHPAYGALDLRDELGQTALFSEINLRLAELARTAYTSVYVVDEDRVQAQVGKAHATDARLWLTARMPWSEPMLLALAAEYLRFLRPLRGLNRKCVAVDLDNTLWGGIVGEDGLAGIQLGADAPGNAFVALQHELLRLWRRGILLAIVSKNNPEDAWAVFDQHPAMVLKRTHFAAHRINWQTKAQNLREICRELNIGLDSLVFLDDNPAERAAVRAALPQVLVPELPSDPAEYRNTLVSIGQFDTLAVTEEDRKRGQLYAEQAARAEAEARFQATGTLSDYLGDLQIALEVEEVDQLSLPRVAQLTNKTNQFNLTTRRYTEAQIRDFRANGAHVYTLRCRDRFGDNGLVGVAIVQAGGDDVADIDTLLLSCRVMGRGVETALLAHVAEQARREGFQSLRGWYIPTAKNEPVKDCYPQHGFELVQTSSDGAQLWQLSLEPDAIATPTWLTVRSPEASASGPTPVAIGSRGK